jgi:hypothetical protein
MNVSFEKDMPCGACLVGKQMGAPYRAKNIITTIRPLKMLHIYLFGPITYISIGGNKYGIVIIGDYSRFTWVFFLQDKGKTQEVLKKFFKRAQNEFDAKARELEVAMTSSLRTLKWKIILMKKTTSMSFRTPTLLNKMGWPKGRIELL